ncbi:MAG: glycosyltransferase [Gammaproteobacteria bacterium]
MLGLFLSCDGNRNTALIQKTQKYQSQALDLMIDSVLAGVVEIPETDTKSPILNINQLCDAGFETDVMYWRMSEVKSVAPLSLGIDFSPDWTLNRGHTAYIFQGNDYETSVELTYHDPVVGELLPVHPKAHYQVGGCFGLHRCDAFLSIKFYDKERKSIGSHDINLTTDKLGGKALGDYFSVMQRVQVPERCFYARLSIKKFPTKAHTEKDSSFLFFTRPFFALVAADSTVLLEWDKSAFGIDEWKQLRGLTLGHYQRVDFQLPESAYDGQHHSIALIDRMTGEALEGTPKTFLFDTEIQGRIDGLHGSRVTGWISDRNSSVEVYVDGQFVAGGVTTPTLHSEVQDRYVFSVPLPVYLLDGRPHHIEVKARPSGKRIGELAEILPYCLTPWDALQKYAGKPLPARLAPAAAVRYDSLRIALQMLAVDAANMRGDELTQYAERIVALNRLHEQLIDGFEKIRKFDPLAFPVVESPDVSIVIPVHNKFAVTYNCLAALLFAYNKASFEVIVVDDGSSDETMDMLELVDGVFYLRNEASQGFIRSCGRGASVARGRYVVMLNNDTEPTARWLDELLFVFEQFDKVGLAGSKLLYPDGKLQEAGGIVWQNGNPWNYGRGGNPQDPRFNYSRQVDYLSGASIMLPKSLWDKLGGFSEEYIPAYFEDTDLAFKVRAAGFKTVYAPLSVVYHFEGVSSGTSVASGTKRYQEINRPKFKHKWIAACRLNGEEGLEVDFNKDRGVNHRALVIDYQTPRPDMDAGSYAAIQEMRLLQSLGFKVTFVPENMAYLGQYTELLQRMGIEVIYAPFAGSVEEILKERGKEFDVVYMTRYYVAKNHLRFVRQHAPKARVLFCNADLHFLREIREAIERKDENALEHARQVREEELAIMRQVDVSLSYNSIEHAVILSHNLQQTKVVTCPWVVDVKESTPGYAARSDIAFLGGFGHPPNKAAVLFFIDQVMPILRQRLPDAKFRIYGSNVPKEIETMAGKDVVVEGYIEDVADVYDSCRVFVAPLLTGAGIKGKVIDALAHGTPSVLTPIAAEGTPLRHGLEVMIAETAEEWADAVSRLYTEQALWENMSSSAREFARNCYSFENGRKLMLKALETADIFVTPDNQALVVKSTRSSLN